MVSGFHFWAGLCLLYLLESIRVTSASAVILIQSARSKAWSFHRPFLYPGGDRSGWLLLPIWPWQSLAIVAQDPLLVWNHSSVAPNTTLIHNPKKAVAFSELQSATTEERSLLINGSKYIQFESPAEAQQAVTRLHHLRKLTSSQRLANLSETASNVVTASPSAKVTQFITNTRSLRRLTLVMWTLCFICLPLALFVAGDIVLIPFLAIVWALSIATAFLSNSARRSLLNPKGFPWGLLRYILYPVSAMRAQDDLAKEFFTDMYPFPLCMSLCQDTSRDSALKLLYLRLRHAIVLEADIANESHLITAAFNKLVTDQMELKIQKTCPELLHAFIPQRADPNCLAYCPRCLTQYQNPSGSCADCPGIKLLSFTSQPESLTSRK